MLSYDSTTVQKVLCTVMIFWYKEAHWLPCTSTPEVCNKLNQLPCYQNVSLVGVFLIWQFVCSLWNDAVSRSDYTIKLRGNGEKLKTVWKLLCRNQRYYPDIYLEALRITNKTPVTIFGFSSRLNWNPPQQTSRVLLLKQFTEQTWQMAGLGINNFSLSRFSLQRRLHVAWWTYIDISNKCTASISYPEGEGRFFFSKISVPTSKTSGHDISQDLGCKNPGCQIA